MNLLKNTEEKKYCKDDLSLINLGSPYYLSKHMYITYSVSDPNSTPKPIKFKSIKYSNDDLIFMNKNHKYVTSKIKIMPYKIFDMTNRKIKK